MERHIFIGYLVYMKNISSNSMNMTKDLIVKVTRQVLQKMGENFWDRNDGHDPMSNEPVVCKLKTDAGQLTLPTVFWVHEYHVYCPRPPPMSGQCYGTPQQPSLVQTKRSDDK